MIYKEEKLVKGLKKSHVDPRNFHILMYVYNNKLTRGSNIHKNTAVFAGEASDAANIRRNFL